MSKRNNIHDPVGKLSTMSLGSGFSPSDFATGEVIAMMYKANPPTNERKGQIHDLALFQTLQSYLVHGFRVNAHIVFLSFILVC
jgi:hypothetical protein